MARTLQKYQGQQTGDSWLKATTERKTKQWVLLGWSTQTTGPFPFAVENVCESGNMHITLTCVTVSFLISELHCGCTEAVLVSGCTHSTFCAEGASSIPHSPGVQSTWLHPLISISATNTKATVKGWVLRTLGEIHMDILLLLQYFCNFSVNLKPFWNRNLGNKTCSGRLGCRILRVHAEGTRTWYKLDLRQASVCPPHPLYHAEVSWWIA